MKNKIFTVLLSLLMVLSTINIVFAEVEYPFTVTYHFKYMTSATDWAEKTWSQKVKSNSGSASKVINKIVSDTTPKTIKTNDTIYTFAKKWKGQGQVLDSTERVYIKNADYTEATDIYYEAVYDEEALIIPTATVHVRYMNMQGEWVENTLTQKIEKGVGWTIKQGAFDDDIDPYKHFEHDGKIYTFTGWDKDLPLTITGIKEDTDYYFNAQYDIKDIRNLTVKCIDNIAHGSTSWSNKGSFTEYTHTFKKPADIPDHYTFLYWKGEDKTYRPGDTLTIKSDDLEEDTTLRFIAVYYYQPALQINYHFNKDDIYTLTSYTDVKLYEEAPKKLKWFYANSTEPITEDEVITVPNQIITSTKVNDNNKKIVDVFARYFIINWLNDDGTNLWTNEDVPYGEIPVYGGETPTKEATAQYTYKFIGWDSEVEPATQDKNYTAVYSEITNIYTITFIDYDGTVLSQADYAYGTAAEDIEKPIPVREPTVQYTYVFSGWTPEIQDVTEDATYMATWEEQEIPPEPEPEPEPEDPEKPTDPDEPKKPTEKPQKKTTTKPETKTTTTFGGWIPTNPTDSEEEDTGIKIIDEYNPPKDVNGKPIEYWALINLLCVILSAILALISLFIKSRKYEDEDVQKYEKAEKRAFKLVGILTFIAGLILFVLSENIFATMRLVDKWTIINVLLAINSILAFYILIDKKKEREDEE